MRKIIEKIKSIFDRDNRKPAKSRRKTRGQSLVEIAISLPFIIILLSGIMEFGFMLNYYLSMLDATREAARFYSNLDPFEDGYAQVPINCTCPVTTCPNEDPADSADADCNRDSFYSNAAAMTIDALQPRDANDTTRKIVLDQIANDDVIISVIGIKNGVVVGRYPNLTGFSQFNHQQSALPNNVIESRSVNTAPNAGILIVEVFYGYHQVLKLPWLKPFLADPSILHAYTIMPLIAAEPPP